MSDGIALVTGASGFVGRHFVQAAAGMGIRVRAALRKPGDCHSTGIESAVVGEIAADTDWDWAMAGVDTVVHCAARVHQINDSSADPLAAFRRSNVDGTLALGRAAARQGVRRFVFVSSIKVNGERTLPGVPFRPNDAVAPDDPYGISKWEAEQGLREIARETGLEVAIIRPVLVYGPGVKANFLSMMRWVDRGLPLPLGAVPNRRSLISVDNLSSLMLTCVHHPNAANQTFLASDGFDLSTTDLLRRVARSLGRPSRLIPVPVAVLQSAATFAGRGAYARRLLGSLQVDIDSARQRLGWVPPMSVDEALDRTARWYRDIGSGSGR